VFIDDFFDNVMVNVDDKELRNSRLSLLNGFHEIMNEVADLSKLAT
jgi:glycyl-tRNA synthetase beta chain